MKKTIYHFIGFIIWTIAFSKLFIFDIDIYLFENYAASLDWIVDFRLIAILLLVVFTWLLLGNQEFLKIFSFILFYPIILLFWTIPVGLIIRRHWFGVFTYLSGFVSTITNFKKNLILITIFLVCTALIFNTGNKFAIYLSGVALLLIALFILFRRAYFAFTPSSIFAIDTKTIVSYLENNSLYENFLENSSDKDDNPKELDSKQSLENERSDEIPDKVPLLIFANRTLYFIAEKLKKFKESRVYVVFFIISLLFTFFSSIVLFSIINYGVYKLDPSSFTILGNEGYFIFLYYSFNAMITNSISAIQPESFLSMTVNMLQFSYGIVLIVILLGTVVSVNTQKYKDDIDQVIYAFDTQSEDVEQILKLNFRMTIHQAIHELERAKHSLIDFIKFIDPEQ